MGRLPTYHLPMEEIKLLYRQGLSDRQIAVRYGVRPSVIGYWRDQWGWESNRQKAADHLADEIKRLVAAGYSDGRIAKAVGRSEDTVRKRRELLGLTRVPAVRAKKPRVRRPPVPKVDKYRDTTDYAEVDRTALAWRILSNGGTLERVVERCGVTRAQAEQYRRDMPEWWSGERA